MSRETEAQQDALILKMMTKRIFMINTFLTKLFHITVESVSYFSLGLASVSLWLVDFTKDIDQESVVALIDKMPIGWAYAIVTLAMVFWIGKIAWLSYKSWFLDRARQMEDIREKKLKNDKQENENKINKQ